MEKPVEEVDALKDVVQILTSVKIDVQKQADVEHAVRLKLYLRLFSTVKHIIRFLDEQLYGKTETIGTKTIRSDSMERRGFALISSTSEVAPDEIGTIESLMMGRKGELFLLSSKYFVSDGKKIVTSSIVEFRESSWFLTWFDRLGLTVESFLTSIRNKISEEIERGEKRLLAIRRRTSVLEDMLEVSTAMNAPAGFKRVTWADVTPGTTVYLPGGGRHKVRPYGPFFVFDVALREVGLSRDSTFPYSRSTLLIRTESC